MLDGINLDDFNPDAVEESIKNGGLLPEGVYHVVLECAKTTESKAKGTRGIELHFSVAEGPFFGHKIKDTLWETDNEKAKTRIVIFASRLGLLVTSGSTYVYAQGKKDFTDCDGAHVWVEVAHETYTNQETKKEGKAPRLTYAGIWRLDEPPTGKTLSKGPNGTPPKTQSPAKAEAKKFDAAELDM